jgi:DNA-binding response OmpR family regulator
LSCKKEKQSNFYPILLLLCYMRVLIVEDDQFLIDAYRAKFGHINNIDIDFARDGDEAFDKIKQNKPDSVILDLLLPNLDGFGLLKKLREERIEVPILVASNLDSQDSIKKAMDLGAKDYFIKSNASIQDIVQKVMNIMAG